MQFVAVYSHTDSILHCLLSSTNLQKIVSAACLASCPVGAVDSCQGPSSQPLSEKLSRVPLCLCLACVRPSTLLHYGSLQGPNGSATYSCERETLHHRCTHLDLCCLQKVDFPFIKVYAPSNAQIKAKIALLSPDPTYNHVASDQITECNILWYFTSIRIAGERVGCTSDSSRDILLLTRA